MQVSNKEFLQAIFGDEWKAAFVTAFADDPLDIETQDQRMRAWAGSVAGKKLRSFKEEENQYFTISLFNTNENGQVRRQKALFDACFVIVLDDVAEKIPVENAELLPSPSYKLLTSAGSEQWGYILDEPDTRRDVIDNLLDGLVGQGLVPNGKDTGMKGVTRYVRLPEGSNTKKSRYVDGRPFKCQMLSWNPERLHCVDELAKAFNIDLYAPRQDLTGVSADKKSKVYTEHPVWPKVTVTGYNGDWAMIECPNAHNHSTADKSGAAVLIRDDGSMAFKCHHGACSGEGDASKMTGVKIAELLGIKDELNDYIHQISVEGNKALAVTLGREIADSAEGFTIERNDDEFNTLRYVYITSDDKFFDTCTGLTLKQTALNNLYKRTYTGKKQVPLAADVFHDERPAEYCIADSIGWIPFDINQPSRESLIVDFMGQRLINSWRGLVVNRESGEVDIWLNLIAHLFPEPTHREALLDYLAFVLQKPSEKVAFTVLHRGYQGIGKDLMLKPIMQAFGVDSSGSVTVDQMTKGWGDYIARKKFLIIEEVDKGQSKKVNNALKTLLAPTATGCRTLNLKGGSVITQLDCLCTYMMTNKRNPISLEKNDRRYLVLDSWVERESPVYYRRIDNWYTEQNGVGKVANYLLNRDISEFNPNKLPMVTEGMKEVTELGMYDYESDLRDLCESKSAPFNLPLITQKVLRAEVKKAGILVTVPSLIETMEDLGYMKCRGVKKIEGEVLNTETFYVKKSDAPGVFGVSAQYDFYEKFHTMGG